MYEGRSLRFFAGFGILIAILIIIIVLIVHHGSSSKVPETMRQLSSYIGDSNATITETIVGPINAQQQHDQVQIDVTNQSTSFQLSQGYDNNVTSSKTYPMTDASFSEFVHALQNAGFTKGNTAANLKDDKGYCPTGNRYIFEVHDGSKTIERYWATSCGGTKSYRGNVNLTLTLFQQQVPDYSTLVQNTDISGTSLFDY